MPVHKMMTYQGKSMNVKQWAKYLGLPYATMRLRVKKYYPDYPEKVFYSGRLRPTRLNEGKILILTYQGKTMSTKEWAKELGVSCRMILARIKAYPDNPEKVFIPGNQRSTQILTYEGKTMSLDKWAKYLGIHRSTLISRIKKYPNNAEKIFKKKSLNAQKNKH